MSGISNPLLTSPRPLASWYPPPEDYGTDPNVIDPEDLPVGWTPQGAALMGGSVTRSPLQQAQYNLALQGVANQANAQGQANQFFQGLQSIDPDSDEGQNGLTRLLLSNPQGAGDPRVQKIVQEIRQAQQARVYNQRYAPLAPEGARFLSNLYTADPTDPEALNTINQQVQEHPEWISHPNIAAPYERYMARANAVREQAKLRPVKNIDVGIQLAAAGLDPDEYKDEEGYIDPIAAAKAMHQAKQWDKLPQSDRKEIIDLKRGAISPSDSDKQLAWQEAHPGQVFDTNNKAHWDEGFNRASAEKMQKHDILRAAAGLAPDRIVRSTSALPVASSGGIQFKRIR